MIQIALAIVSLSELKAVVEFMYRHLVWQFLKVFFGGPFMRGSSILGPYYMRGS